MNNYYKLILFLVLLLSPFLNSISFCQGVKIGVALPLFEESDDPAKKQLGSDILNGIEFALNEYNRSPVIKITLDIRDTKRDPVESERIIDAFAQDSSIVCVLGPVFSSELLEVANIGVTEKLPIISPTATADDIAESHDYVFQLNPSYKVRGTLMADYLVKIAGLKNFVIIYEESYGSNFSEHFETEVGKLGGKVLLSSSYNKDAKNITDIITQIIKVIRDNDLFINPANLNVTQLKKLENSGVRYSLLDSLVTQKTDVSIYYLFGHNARKVIDTLNIKAFQLKPDATNFIQGYIDAIYIPISNPSEISMIVPELYSNKLSFFIAGTGDWNNEEILNENKVYLKNLIFESEYYIDENNQAFKELKTKISKTKITLNKSFLFGFDSMNLLLSIISSGNITRDRIRDALKKVVSYDAVRSKISLDFNRVNSELNILAYDNGLKKVASYKISK